MNRLVVFFYVLSCIGVFIASATYVWNSFRALKPGDVPSLTELLRAAKN